MAPARQDTPAQSIHALDVIGRLKIGILMNLIQRVQDLLLRPRSTWLAIEQESTDLTALYKDYLVYLAAIPAIAGFLGMSLVGVGAFGVNVRIPIADGLAHMVVGYLVSLGMVYVIGVIVNALAPQFDAEPNLLQSIKLVGYGSTAGFVGGVFSLIPALAWLGLLASAYSAYLIYIGLPILMKCPPEKAVVYAVVVTVCGIVATVILGAVTGAGLGMTLP